MNPEKIIVKTEQAEQQQKPEKKLTIRTGIRGGLAVRLMID